MDSQLPFRVPVLESLLNAASALEVAMIEAKDPQGDGAWQQRDRVEAAAAWACEHFPGDLVEIGCLHGSTTVRMASVARHFGRRVIAIDPWEIGTQNCAGGEYEIFCQTIEPYKDVIEVMQVRSDAPSIITQLKARTLAFAFVDGLHTYAAATGDLHAVAHASLIALDDTRWSTELQFALELFGLEESQRPRQFLQRPYWRESWIV